MGSFLRPVTFVVNAAMLLLSRSMLAILLAAVAVIPAASARNVAFADALKKVLDDIIDSWADNEWAEMPELGAPSWRQRVENKHMCEDCNNKADALQFSQWRNQWCNANGLSPSGVNTVFLQDYATAHWHQNADTTWYSNWKVHTYNCSGIPLTYPYNKGYCKYIGKCYPGPFDNGLSAHLYYNKIKC